VKERRFRKFNNFEQNRENSFTQKCLKVFFHWPLLNKQYSLVIVLLAKTYLEMFEKSSKILISGGRNWICSISWANGRLCVQELFQNIIISNVIPLAEAEFAVSGIGFC